MTPQEKIVLSQCLLVQLERAQPLALSLEWLMRGATLSGSRANKRDIEHELAALQTKGYVVCELNCMHLGLTRYRIGAEGLRYLESENLA